MISSIQKNIIIRALRLRKDAGEEPAEVLERYGNLTAEEKAEILEALEV